jgi:penicillin-binding protein 2
MRQVMLEGSSIYFDDCIVEVAGKTGTSQVMRTTESGVTMKCNNGFFISFAPYDDPQIAVAVVAENALTGSRTSQAAADVYNYYFGQRTNVDEVVPPNTLIG